MLGISTVTTKGQITIPSFIREELSLQPGSQVKFQLDRPGKRILAQLASKNIIEELAGSIKTKVKFTSRAAERRSAQEYVAGRHLLRSK